jgi:hypothetical protein
MEERTRLDSGCGTVIGAGCVLGDLVGGRLLAVRRHLLRSLLAETLASSRYQCAVHEVTA